MMCFITETSNETKPMTLFHSIDVHSCTSVKIYLGYHLHGGVSYVSAKVGRADRTTACRVEYSARKLGGPYRPATLFRLFFRR